MPAQMRWALTPVHAAVASIACRICNGRFKSCAERVKHYESDEARHSCACKVPVGSPLLAASKGVEGNSQAHRPRHWTAH